MIFAEVFVFCELLFNFCHRIKSYNECSLSLLLLLFWAHPAMISNTAEVFSSMLLVV